MSSLRKRVNNRLILAISQKYFYFRFHKDFMFSLSSRYPRCLLHRIRGCQRVTRPVSVPIIENFHKNKNIENKTAKQNILMPCSVYLILGLSTCILDQGLVTKYFCGISLVMYLVFYNFSNEGPKCQARE